ncbi:hypothetical protein [Flavobacterium gelatinilyticum]|uniref:hypothetical protein n=1 Tax=Flavobacterium gelatinilyticum TaxID=3003260 RepID=UPI002480AF44|nr:hypothetical protein [Flavobacterium gelatinilyticum]
MNTENIKLLRSKISIPLDKAMQLLKKNNDDVALSELDFHNENIIEICQKTDCEEETARKEYQICNYDVTKTIERINQKVVVIATGNNLDSKIGFILWPQNKEGEFYKTEKRNDAFISAEDFEIVLKVFQSVFPLQNLWNNEVENRFDEIGHNFFDAETSRLIVEKIKLLHTNDEKEKAFLLQIINWLNDKLIYADCIVVYGNL